MIDRILEVPEIKNLLEMADKYEDDGFVEYSFTGEIPFGQAGAIRDAKIKMFDGKDEIYESDSEQGIEESLSIRFLGRPTHNRQSYVEFFYSQEVIELDY